MYGWCRGVRTSSFEPLYRRARFAGFVDNSWITIDEKQDTFLLDYRDAFSVAVNPANPKNVYIGTLGYGLLEYIDGKFVKDIQMRTVLSSSIHLLRKNRCTVWL